MDKPQNIAILGLGLMGASLALALKKRGFSGGIVGYARRDETRVQALESGMLDAVFADPAESVREADIVVICVPIWTIAKLAQQIISALKPGAVVTDVGSTKSELLKTMQPLFARSEACFIGSHPIAGSEKTGLEAGNPDLYEGRLTIVCASPEDPPEATQQVRRLWQTVGSNVTELGPDAHDSILAATSHMPHMVAAVLARTVSEEKLGGIAEFCGTGFKDTTRVASGSPEMWVDIIDTNRIALKEQLGLFSDELNNLIDVLENDDRDVIKKWLEDARDDRNEILKHNRSLER